LDSVVHEIVLLKVV
jgi:hypothetical protein